MKKKKMEAERWHGGVRSRASARPCGGGVKFSSSVAVGFGHGVWGSSNVGCWGFGFGLMGF